MSEGKKLNTLPVVTTLNSGEYLIASDANGNGKRISKGNVTSKAQIRTVAKGDSNWLRVAVVSLGTNAGIIRISKDWGSGGPAMLVFAYLLHPNGSSSIEAIIKLGMESAFSKVRLVAKSNSSGYIDVYTPLQSSKEQVTVESISGNAISIPDTANATIPEGYYSTEFDMTNRGGKMLFYNYLERRCA